MQRRPWWWQRLRQRKVGSRTGNGGCTVCNLTQIPPPREEWKAAVRRLGATLVEGGIAEGASLQSRCGSGFRKGAATEFPSANERWGRTAPVTTRGGQLQG